MLRELDLPAGSMGPKVEAATRFVEATGATAAIGSLAHIGDIVAGAAGTQVVPSEQPRPTVFGAEGGAR
jgi:carbamate kinase